MLRKLIKNKKAQNTAEYAILISLVVAGIVAMQTYAQRALQARVYSASELLSTSANSTEAAGWSLGEEKQYEPYYLNQSYDVTSEDQERRSLGNQDVSMDTASNRTRQTGGYQNTMWNADDHMN
ncbi:MAG: hypothetical protein P9X22_09275 [Candidatus Zapsychrus exili]|nr:hypothetical protein [Candidatus Zapsychrus exili]